MSACPRIPESVENVCSSTKAGSKQGSMYIFPAKATTERMHDWMARATNVDGLWARHEMAMASELVHRSPRSACSREQSIQDLEHGHARIPDNCCIICRGNQAFFRDACACPILLSRITCDTIQAWKLLRSESHAFECTPAPRN